MTKENITVTFRYDSRVSKRSPKGCSYRFAGARIPKDTRVEEILGFLKADSLIELDPADYKPIHEYEPNLTRGEFRDHGIYEILETDLFEMQEVLEDPKFESKLVKSLKKQREAK